MATIGSLTADLRLESAAFIRDLKKAADATARNTGAMRRSIAGMQAGFARAAATFKGVVAGFVSIQSVRALSSLGRTAIQTADDIATAATKIGISGEELQRLRFAAEQADVEISELDNAIKLFQKNLATGKIQSQSFDDFIQSIREAPTHIEKVRIAQDGLGGKAFQTGLLLAQAGDAFAENYQKAFAVSEKALSIAGELDNEWRALSNSIATGFQTGFLESFGGEAARTKEELARFNEVARATGAIFGGLVSGTNKVIGFFANLRENVFQLREEVRKAQAERAGQTFLPTLEFDMLPQYQEATEVVTSGINDINQALVSEADASRAAAEAQSAWLQRLQEGGPIFEATRAPLEAYRLELERLTELLNQGSIDAETFGRAQTMAAASAISPWLNVADTIGGALGQLFDDNKAVAIAQAIINTAQGVTAALAQYPPPLSFAMAAAQAAAGAVQIATIKSARPGSGGSARKPSAGGGSGKRVEASSSSGASSAVQDRAVFVNLQGSGRYSREEVFSLIDQLVEAQKDGARLILSRP